MPLKPADLTKAIEDAFAKEWPNYKGGMPLPAAGKEDRKLMFAAVARGVLEYLAGTTEVLSQIALKDSAGNDLNYDVTSTTMNIDAS